MNPIDEIMSKFPHESLPRRMCIASGISEWELPIVVSELLGAGAKEILDLREAVRVLAEDVLDLNECFKRPYRGDETQIIEYINPKVLANPIAAAAVEAARKGGER